MEFIVYNASGARGFYSEGYWWHFCIDWGESIFVTKTITAFPNSGNMRSNIFPKCIIVKPFDGVVLNAVGLTNPGINVAIQNLKSQKNPWVLSIAVLNSDENCTEIKYIVDTILKSKINNNFSIQLNESCPNVESKDNKNTIKSLQILKEYLGVPVYLKVNVLTPLNWIINISNYYTGIVVSNSIPYGTLQEHISWEKYFGKKSPLEHIGGGGLSGKPLLPLVCNWIKNIRNIGFTKQIIGGGGILSKDNAISVLMSGANAIELGSISILRPWRISSLVKEINMSSFNNKI